MLSVNNDNFIFSFLMQITYNSFSSFIELSRISSTVLNRGAERHHSSPNLRGKHSFLPIKNDFACRISVDVHYQVEKVAPLLVVLFCIFFLSRMEVRFFQIYFLPQLIWSLFFFSLNWLINGLIDFQMLNQACMLWIILRLSIC